MNITHEHPEYKKLRIGLGDAKNNGCWYYSIEIVNNIMPNVETKREWNTVGRELTGMKDGMIVFLHDNATPWHYDWLKKYKDLVLVCSSQYTADSVKYSGKTIVLPMSIDTEYVKQFRVPEKTEDTCFVGNRWVQQNLREIPTRVRLGKVDYISGVEREEMLEKVALYRNAYAIDRCAQEVQVLGCKLLPLNIGYGCDSTDVLDNRDAAKILQEQLDLIDKGGKNV